METAGNIIIGYLITLALCVIIKYRKELPSLIAFSVLITILLSFCLFIFYGLGYLFNLMTGF
jgi:hypothetical protein